MLDFSSAAMQLPQGQLDAARVAGSCSAASRLSITGSRLSAKRSRAYFWRGGGLGLGALAGVVGVGQRAHHGVALLLDLGLGFGEQVLERLFAALRLNGFFLHLVEIGAGMRGFKLFGTAMRNLSQGTD